ncbi:MAG: homoserine O-acetyltransferase [Planctomycetaceae bacterium]|nr:homoserine O-acetyltransferase [Planctomycetaceae bacterium]
MTAETDARTPADEHSVGLVETQFAELFSPPNPLQLRGGTTLGPITVAYQTYGELSPEKDNAIYVCHALTGDMHAAGRMEKRRKSGWWDGFIGPGKTLDTNRYFVICANVLGGCQGTTGPASLNPESGRPYGIEFPFVTVEDIVNVQAELVRHLGIDQLLAVIGGSLGGMQVLQWAADHPEQLNAAIVLASAARLSAQGIAFNAVGRRAIYADPNFKDGQYYEQEEGPRFGLALARMVAHITYLSEDSIELKFGRRLQDSETLSHDLHSETEFQIESYLHYQGKRFVERFDANSYLYLTKAMDYFELAPNPGDLAQTLSKTDARFLVVSYDTDWLFTTAQSKEIVRALLSKQKHVTFSELSSPYGHDSFLIELDQLRELVEPFLHETLKATRG